MLDFDFVCRRPQPSVACIVYPFTGDHKLKFYWGHKEVLIPGELKIYTIFVCHTLLFIFRYLFVFCLVYKYMKDALNKHKDTDVMVNFASLRSAYDSTKEAMSFPQVFFLIDFCYYYHFHVRSNVFDHLRVHFDKKKTFPREFVRNSFRRFFFEI